jgi:hypothetical protein
VWQRHGLLTKHDRVLRLERTTAERKVELADAHIRLLGRFSPEFRELHIEAPHAGSLMEPVCVFPLWNYAAPIRNSSMLPMSEKKAPGGLLVPAHNAQSPN